jgi:hypothetical protein
MGAVKSNCEAHARIDELSKAAFEEKNPAKKQRLVRQLYQAQEALLCADNRERHATHVRYAGIVQELRDLHHKDPANLVDLDAALSFEGDSYLEKLIDICVSHNESADALVRRDPANPDRPRFPRDYPVGSTTADLQFVAATLRMADILDFDRERTPPVLFHYFVPGALSAADDRSALEWSKHLAISNWHIDPEEIVFRGRCRSHIVHHGIVHFCDLIAEEIAATRATFTEGNFESLFSLPKAVKADIHEEGYTYVPYRFELDDERIYRLLMGGAIYSDPLHAIRELVQNAVDACRLRDALTLLNDPGMTPGSENRIIITYQEATVVQPYPTLEVHDTGTGMDALVINRWFLKVGRSFYGSAEFNQFRVQLRKRGLDFAPTSEFGIGFLATFLLADKVEVETAMWEPLHGDTRKRVLEIHGPTRLIRLSDNENTGVRRFRGTRVKLTLTRGQPLNRALPPTWAEVRAYLTRNCASLPYWLHLRHVVADSVDETVIKPQDLTIELSEPYKDHAVRIPVDDAEAGLKGEIVFLHPLQAQDLDRIVAQESAARIVADDLDSSRSWSDLASSLIRGGFRVGPVPGMPTTYRTRGGSRAVISLDWKNRRERRYPLTNVARTALVEELQVGAAIIRNWLNWLLEHINELPEGLLDGFDFPGKASNLKGAVWLQHFDAFELCRLAANGWHSALKLYGVKEEEIALWEQSKGKPLPRLTLGGECHVVLQDLVLPKVCQLQMGPQGRFYLTSPISGWIKILRSWREYITAPVSWGSYVEYVGSIKDLVYYEYPRSDYLNGKYRERVETVFSESEISELIEGLRVLADNKQERQIELSVKALSILRRAQEELGDLRIGELFQSWPIDSFKLPTTPIV